MRESHQAASLHVRAIGGLHVVSLAWDFPPGQTQLQQNLLGFAIERAELRDGKIHERFFIRGIKRFRFKDAALPPGAPVPTSEHPVQSFQWGDYTAKPETTYRYRVVPVYGKPNLLNLDDAASASVEISTEAEVSAATAADVRHNIYFNRGVAGSQSFARNEFKKDLDENKPDSPAMKWLSRGLFEALSRFIRRAAGTDAADYALRAMLYEFRYLPVGLLFKEARDAGADVDVRFEAQEYAEENNLMISQAGIGDICKPQTVRDGIRHNKFIVLLHKGNPVAVWTGSTNISAGGIFGHSNVGHEVWSETIAKTYLEAWERFSAPDIDLAALRAANAREGATPAANDLPGKGEVLTLFSPRESGTKSKTLAWYAGLFGSPQQKIACATFAFNLDKVFADVLRQSDNVLRYAVFDKNPGKGFEKEIQSIGNTVIAPGAILAKGDLANFAAEKLTGFNHNNYIHDKFLLIDPLGRDPVVITGSANFSSNSQTANDENMLIIRANQRVADIYFGEFMRVFDHLYARYLVKKLKEENVHDPNAGYLKEDWQDWVPAHFAEGNRKCLRRVAFMSME